MLRQSLICLSFLALVARLPALAEGSPKEKDSGPAMSLEKAADSEPAIAYQLPRNYFDFQFALKTSAFKRGLYCDLAKYFFDLKESPDCSDAGDSTSVSLVTPITVTEMAEADPTARYRVKINSGAFTESNLTLSFGDGGVLTGFQSTVADHRVDFFISILKTAADVIGHVIHPAAIAAHAPLSAHPPLAARADALKGICVNDELDQAERAALARLGNSHKKLACSLAAELRSAYLAIPDQYLGFVDVYVAGGKTVDDHFMNALSLFTELREIELSDVSFLHPGTLPANPDAYSAILKSREDRKESLRAQFLGSSSDSTDPVPEIVWHFADGSGKAVELFSFDSAGKGGFCFRDSDPSRWFSRPIGVEDCKVSATLVTVRAMLRSNSAPASVSGGGAGQGLAYRVPGTATLRIYAETDKEYDYVSHNFEIAQFGAVAYLPARMGTSTSYNVSLDPLTGNLKNVVVGVKPPLTGDLATQVDGLSTSLLGAYDGYKASKKQPSALDAAQSQEQLKLQQLKIQLIDSCRTDPTQTFCATLIQ